MAEVFISYSRKDIAFARLLHEALTQGQMETWIDWARIPVGEKWWDEICTAIEQSNIFLFIISSHSVGSEVCKKEVDQALSHNKRIIPVIVDETPEDAIRQFVPDLTAINWIIFRHDDVFKLEARPDENLGPEEQVAALPREPQFQQALEKLNAAIHIDWAWVKAHTRLETRAREWERHKREGSWLLRGKDLQEAEQWSAQVGAKTDPQPTDLQREYVLASRRAETRRQRLTLGASLGASGIISICLVIAIVFGVLALRAQQTAESNLVRSESLRLAAEAENILSQPDGNVETAALLSIRALQRGYIPQADVSLAKSLPRLYAIRVFTGHTNYVYSVAFSPDGKYVLTGSGDKTAKLWDASTGAQVRTFSGHTASVESVAFSPDGKYVLTGSDDATVKLWEASTGTEVRTLSGHTNYVLSVAFSLDGKYVLTGSADNTAKLWDASTGTEVRTFSGHTGPVKSAAFSPDGKYVLTGSFDGTAKLWEVATGAEVRTFSGDTSYLIWSVAFSPDGMYVLIGSADGTAKLWDAATGAEVRTFSGHRANVSSVIFSPDGKYVLTGSADNTARMWDAATGTEVRIFSGHTSYVESVAFSPDGKYVLTGSADDTARLWDIATSADLHILSGHTTGVSSVAFSPDGKYVLTGSGDKTAKLWDIAAGAEIRTFSGHTNTVTSVAFSPDGKYVLTGSDDATAKLWDMDYKDTIRRACAHLTRDLTMGERTQYLIVDNTPTCP